jgi:hypothetical protein
MADYEVKRGEIGVYDKTLTPDVIDTVVFNAEQAIDLLEFMTDGAGAIYLTTDGSDPTISGAHCRKIPAVRSVRTVRVAEDAQHTEITLKLLSEGAPEYDISKP